MSFLSTVLSHAPHLVLPLGEASGTVAADASGAGRNGTYVGGPTLARPALVPSGGETTVQLDGFDDHVTVPSGVFSTTVPFTVAFAVEATPAASSTIYGEGSSAATIPRFALRAGIVGQEARLAVELRTAENTGTINNAQFARADMLVFNGQPCLAWFTMDYAAGTATLYRGDLITGVMASQTMTFTPAGTYTGLDRFAFGARSRASVDQFLAATRLGWVATYPSALTAAQVQAQFDAREDVDAVAPSVPGDLVAVAAGQTSADLSWTAATDDSGAATDDSGAVAGYGLWRDGVKVGADVLGLARTDTGLRPSRTYSYQVDAVDAAGNRSARSDPASVTTDRSGVLYRDRSGVLRQASVEVRP